MDLQPIRLCKQGAALLALTLATAALGQAANYPKGAIVQSLEAGPGDDLSRYLAELNSAPRSLSALLGAARSALALGDVQAALTFYGRAEEVAPRDGRVKAGMAAAFLASENLQAAFKYFADAQSLGVPVAEFAGDRGLAYDLAGDPVRAQADYSLALRRERDPEVERRLALSRAISGDKAGALAVLEPQIQKQDRAGWRTRAFVLALTGDAAGAASVAQTMMPGNQSAAMRPFLEKLPQLSAAGKAMAVHFGHFPSNGGSPVYAAAQVPAYVPPQASSAAPVQRTAAGYGPSYRGVTAPAEKSTAPVTSRPAPAPIRSLALAPSASADTPHVSSKVEAAPAQVRPIIAAAPVSDRPIAPAPSASADTRAAPVPAKADLAPSRLQFADVVEAVETLPEPVQRAQAMPFKPATSGTPPKLADLKTDTKAPVKAAEKKPAVKPVSAEKKAADKKPDAKAGTKTAAKKTEPAKPKEPARIWVQVAAGQNKAVLPAEYKKIQGKATKLLAGKTAWTAPLGASNRLLVGPFKSDTEARELVNELAKLKVGSYPWKSEDGQKVEKVGAK